MCRCTVVRVCGYAAMCSAVVNWSMDSSREHHGAIHCCQCDQAVGAGWVVCAV